MGLVPKKEGQTADSKNKQKKQTKSSGEKKFISSWRDKVSDHLPTQINPSKSVGVRLFLIFFVAIMFFVLSIGILSYQMAKSTIQNNAENSNLQTIVQTSQKLDIILQKYEENLQQTFLDNEMQKAIMNASLMGVSEYDRFTTINDIRNRLNSLVYSSKGVEAVYMMSVDGSLDDISTGSSSQSFFEAARKEPWYDEMSKTVGTRWIKVPEKSNGKSTVRLVRSLSSVTTSKRFVLVQDLNVEVLENYLKEINLGDNSKLQIVGTDNVVVGSSLEGESGEPTEYDLSKAEGKKGGIRISDANENSVLAVYNNFTAADWKLIGTVSTAELVKDAKGILLATYIAAAVVALITILIAMWMVRMIAHPLAQLKNLMEEGSRGNLNVRLKTKSQDEIGQLTNSFNVMMEQITELVKQTNHSAKDVLDTATELTQASNKTAISAKEIAIATDEIANGATSLANEAERGNELTENISRQMEQVVQSNKQMEIAAHQVEKSSQQGTVYLNGLLAQTNSTVDIVNSLTEKVDALKSSTSSVMKVLEVMQNITQQTNILSLNATIEAARAGAAGRGFMVVADEIRQLADQSRQSITMVGEITDNIQQEMNETVQALSDASPLFQQQINSVKETSQIFVSVQEQMEGFVKQIEMVTASIDDLNESQNVLSEAMSNVSAVAQQSSATSEEVASLSSEQQTVSDQLVQLSGKLENVSNGLKESLSKFTV
ncbi:methyl-accepting chemotaxis protein [Paenibacillus motobuensis]|uniref:Methyl-accepting chemotaxis protein n=1 Tax=Paenibacillus motobuensis TaxID=295324 RepID=A0ABP3HVC2_9BACL